jgi:hypothetical protein
MDIRDEDKKRFTETATQPFQTIRSRVGSPGDNMVFMNAAEYSAAQLGLINEKLDRIAAALEKIAEKP